MKTKIGYLRECEQKHFVAVAKQCFTNGASGSEPVRSVFRKRLAISIAAWGQRDPVDSLGRFFDEPFCFYENVRGLRGTTETGADILVGFAVFGFEKPLAMELLMVGIHPDFQKRGYGRRLITGLSTVAKKHRTRAYGFPLIVARVSETDLGAQLFFKGCGFVGTKTIERENETFYEMIFYQRPPRPYRRRRKKPESEKAGQN